MGGRAAVAMMIQHLYDTMRNYVTRYMMVRGKVLEQPEQQ
jgi:hypothetical protein